VEAGAAVLLAHRVGLLGSPPCPLEALLLGLGPVPQQAVRLGELSLALLAEPALVGVGIVATPQLVTKQPQQQFGRLGDRGERQLVPQGAAAELGGVLCEALGELRVARPQLGQRRAVLDLLAQLRVLPYDPGP
jgi:hypothetical protein